MEGLWAARTRLYPSPAAFRPSRRPSPRPGPWPARRVGWESRGAPRGPLPGKPPPGPSPCRVWTSRHLKLGAGWAGLSRVLSGTRSGPSRIWGQPIWSGGRGPGLPTSEGFEASASTRGLLGRRPGPRTRIRARSPRLCGCGPHSRILMRSCGRYWHRRRPHLRVPARTKGPCGLASQGPTAWGRILMGGGLRGPRAIRCRRIRSLGPVCRRTSTRTSCRQLARPRLDIQRPTTCRQPATASWRRGRARSPRTRWSRWRAACLPRWRPPAGSSPRFTVPGWRPGPRARPAASAAAPPAAPPAAAGWARSHRWRGPWRSGGTWRRAGTRATGGAAARPTPRSGSVRSADDAPTPGPGPVRDGRG